MHAFRISRPAAAAAAVLLSTLLPLRAGAQSEPADGSWKFGGSIYGYLPFSSGDAIVR